MEEKQLRYRINIKILAKGQKQWECTTDGLGFNMEEILDKSDKLVVELEKRYPPESK